MGYQTYRYAQRHNRDTNFDAIICSKVLEHVSDNTYLLDEFARQLKFGGVMMLTASFGSNVHMAPLHYSTGFSKYWYEYQLVQLDFCIEILIANGDWYAM